MCSSARRDCQLTASASGGRPIERPGICAPGPWQASGYERGGERAYQRGRLQQYRRISSDGSTVFYADLLTYSTVTPAPEVCVYEVWFSGDVP